MKSDLLCQEASASSPAAPSGGNGENNPRKSTFLGRQPPQALRRCLGGFPEAVGHRARHGERRCRGPRLPRGSARAARRGAAKDGTAPREGKQAPGCIFRWKTRRIFFFFCCFANNPSFSRALRNALRSAASPCPVPPRGCNGGWVLLDLWATADSSHPAEPMETICADKWKTICARDSNHYHLG